jgi:hypothetical protein
MASVRTLAILGLKGANVENVTEISASDISVPFQLPPGDLWKTHVTGVTIEEEGVGSNLYIKSLDLVLSSTGQPIEIITMPPVGTKLIRFPSAALYAPQLASVEESYQGIPQSDARIPLSLAISKSWGAGSAKQIVVYYVNLVKSQWKTPRAVWIVHAWGMPAWNPVGGRPEDVPERARNHLRSEIDATSGERYVSDTIPQPG